jgi:glutaredoxin
MNILDWVKTDIQKDILEKKYFYENETLDQWFDRISGENESIKKLIIEKKFIINPDNHTFGYINLSEFVVNQFQNLSYFDYFNFAISIYDIVTYLNYNADKINSNKIHIGVVGFASTLIKLGIVYGSKKSFELCDSIGFALINYTIKQSCNMASEYGAFKNFDIESLLNNKIFKESINDDIWEDIKKYGLRNNNLLTYNIPMYISELFAVSHCVDPIIKNNCNILHSIMEDYLDYNDVSINNLPDFFIDSESILNETKIKMNSILQNHIESININNSIELIGKNNCNRCEIVKNILKNKNINFVYIDFNTLSDYEQSRYLNIASSSNANSFPLIIKNNKLINIQEV